MSGYTRIPNEFLDALAPTLSEVELRLLLAIFRQTLGWQRNTAPLSLSQLQRATGLTNRTHMVRTLRTLEAKNLVRTRPQFTADGRPSATLYEVVPAGYLVPVGDGVSPEHSVSPGYPVPVAHPVSVAHPVPVEDQNPVSPGHPIKKERQRREEVSPADAAIWEATREALRRKMNASNWTLRIAPLRLVGRMGDEWQLQAGDHGHYGDLHAFKWAKLVAPALSAAAGQPATVRWVPPATHVATG